MRTVNRFDDKQSFIFQCDEDTEGMVRYLCWPALQVDHMLTRVVVEGKSATTHPLYYSDREMWAAMYGEYRHLLEHGLWPDDWWQPPKECT